MTPLEAATHADPYAYYARLRRNEELLFDAELGLWVASRAETVEAVLAHPDCRVRPPHEPVPPAIAQRAAGQVFARLMRMNEGAAHRCPRAIIEPALAALDAQHVATVVRQLSTRMKTPDEWMFTLPVSVVAHLLGVPCTQLKAVAGLTRDFVACLSPLSNAAQLQKADIGVSQLSQMFNGVLEEIGLLALIRRGDWQDAQVLNANLIGLLSQTCEATAGLIGNTRVLLCQRPDLVEQILRAPTLVAALVEEVARYDSPVQNTRRFVARRCTIGRRVVEAGDTILVLLAAANRDPDANPDPDTFQLERAHRRVFSFGSGRHHCPGQTLALTIASHVILAMLQRQPSLFASAIPFSYWPSLNGRIPSFCSTVLQQ
ncbi:MULTISPECIES: cytochrome P450 [Pseudomonas]|uniref:cytochrome P450 n=1 Tax=Pseudomonas TaxID=286 RepID=UPI0008127BB0|nr:MULTISPECIES: cytochrome P450 [unclassified Pseudomonas]MBW8126469.1 cytochrome P450 [Pseudomonas sp. LAP_36]MBW8135916.1 cytochrome P450 [Pseudomonas sp. PAMC 26818]CRM61520.1 Biotin biosynthesis cytochrome P450 [Pseudomonas sp. 24 E 1]